MNTDTILLIIVIVLLYQLFTNNEYKKEISNIVSNTISEYSKKDIINSLTQKINEFSEKDINFNTISENIIDKVQDLTNIKSL